MYAQNARPQNSRNPVAFALPDQMNHLLVPGPRHMGPPFGIGNGPPQPVEVDLNRSIGSYPTWPGSQYPVGPLETDLTSPYPNNGGQVKTVQLSPTYISRSTQGPLETYIDDNNGPWVPKETIQLERFQSRSHPSAYRNPGYGPNIGPYHRPTGSASDNGKFQYSGTLPSDSGYGTRVSLESASVRSLGLMDRDVDGSAYSDHRSIRVPLEPNLWTEPNEEPEILARDPAFFCKPCGKFLRTRSELKKHHSRHTKPFICNIKGCTREEGFATTNDLLRHISSKHTDQSAGKKSWCCVVDRCTSKDKRWPRSDNFKCHLKRVHKISDEKQLDFYLQRGAEEAQSRIGFRENDEQGLDPVDSSGDFSFQEVSDPEPSNESSVWNSDPMEPAHPGPLIDPSLGDSDLTKPFVAPAKDCTMGMDPIGAQFGANQIVSHRQQEGTDHCSEISSGSSRPDDSLRKESLDTTIMKSPTPSTSNEVDGRGKNPKPDATANSDHQIEAIIAALEAQNIPARNYRSQGSPGVPNLDSSDLAPVADLTRQTDMPGTSSPSDLMAVSSTLDVPIPSPKEDSAARAEQLKAILEVLLNAGFEVKKKVPTPTGTIGNDQCESAVSKTCEKKLPCTKCDKFKGRPCELKKHMKRHDRPYGCTFSGCSKSFGSKNDWKRHENSQHYQVELWRCNEHKCKKLFYHVTAYKSHLTDMHKIEDEATKDSKATSNRIGKNSQETFWCGFCKDLIKLSTQGVEAWKERFNHIDDHFMGRNGRKKQSITEWIQADERSESPKPASKPQGDSPEDSTSTSSSSSSSSSGSPSDSPPKSGDENAALVSEKSRKRAFESSGKDSDMPSSKKPRQGRKEIFVQCCDCKEYSTYDSKGGTVCISCEHKECVNCNRSFEAPPRERDIDFN